MTTVSQSAASEAKPPVSGGEVPRHVAIIMDGNGRWARTKGLARLVGHEHGIEAVRGCVKGCRELGVEFLTLYAFSTENWKRPKSEVYGLMKLLERFLAGEIDELHSQRVRLQTIGRTTDLPASTQKEVERCVEMTAQNDGLTLVLALSYSGRSEIVDGIQGVLKDVMDGKLMAEKISPELFSTYLYTRNYPDPDLLIRTSGEMRLSNFLLWQLSYTEIYITQKFWPDFRKEDLIEAVQEFAKRHRRFGAI